MEGRVPILYGAHTASRGAAEQQGGRRVGERPHDRGTQGWGRRTLSVALTASGYASRSACTTTSDELYQAA